MLDEQNVDDDLQEEAETKTEEEEVVAFFGDEEDEISEEEVEEKKEEEKKPEIKPEITEAEKEYMTKIKQLEKEKKGLNTALHQARQHKKTAKKETEEVLTPDQIKTLLKEHAGDEEVLYNIVQYMSEQTNKEQIDATELNMVKTQHDAYVVEHWPDMADETSELSQKVDATMTRLRVENHPMNKYIAISALITEELPNIRKAAYEQGLAAGKKGGKKTPVTKKNKTNVLTPAGIKSTKTKKSNLSDNLVKTAKQMGLSKAQQKIYARLLDNK